MKKVLILFAHPRFENSRVNQAMVTSIPKIPEITFHDLYEAYPDFNVNIEKEKKLLLEHEIVLWQHPIYWYSGPPLLKQWMDLVLEFGWAYGPGGNALQGKKILNVVSAGGRREAYQSEGHNRFKLREFLTPFDQTATLCKMTYLPPFAIQGTHRLTESTLKEETLLYQQLLLQLGHCNPSSLDCSSIVTHEFINEWVKELPPIEVPKPGRVIELRKV